MSKHLNISRGVEAYGPVLEYPKAIELFARLCMLWSFTALRVASNARSETVAEKPSFRDAWAHGRRCIIPCESIFEPNWESGKAVRWRNLSACTDMGVTRSSVVGTNGGPLYTG